MSTAIALLFALSIAQAGGSAGDCPPDEIPEWIEAVRNTGKEAAYLCLAELPEARSALIEFLKTADSETKGARRVQRALALHVMQRLDKPADVASLRSLNADDRRFLRDAVHARRGRQSPIPAHHEVFSKFDWYAPSRGYRSSMLTDLDRANLAVIDKPPRQSSAAPKVASAADAMPAAPAAPDAPTAQTEAEGCGCSGAGAASVGGLGLAVLWTAGRRRSDPPTA